MWVDDARKDLVNEQSQTNHIFFHLVNVQQSMSFGYWVLLQSGQLAPDPDPVDEQSLTMLCSFPSSLVS